MGWRSFHWPIPGRILAGFNGGIGPSYFNTVTGNTVSNAQIGISISASDFRVLHGPIDWPLSMGNVVRGNRVDHTRGFGVWTGRRGKWNAPFNQAPGFSLIGNLIEGNEVREARALYGGDERNVATVFRHNQGRLDSNIQGAERLLARPSQAIGWLTEDNRLEIAEPPRDSPANAPGRPPAERPSP